MDISTLFSHRSPSHRYLPPVYFDTNKAIGDVGATGYPAAAPAPPPSGGLTARGLRRDVLPSLRTPAFALALAVPSPRRPAAGDDDAVVAPKTCQLEARCATRDAAWSAQRLHFGGRRWSRRGSPRA
jgi:hypothetical protein